MRFCFSLKSARFVSGAEWGEQRIVALVAPTRPEPTFSRYISSAMGCALQPGECV